MSTGLCYSCRHISPSVTHCYGRGDLEPSEYWPGFTCTCPCRNSDTIDLPALEPGVIPEVADMVAEAECGTWGDEHPDV